MCYMFCGYVCAFAHKNAFPHQNVCINVLKRACNYVMYLDDYYLKVH